jgi:AcrR family transcriptional regulator
VPADNRQPPEGLTRERIARVALELADREGLDALSMRRLASELSIGTMTLYGYFRTKDELLDAAVDVAAAEAPVSLGGGTWREQLTDLMRGVLEHLRRHPAGVRIRLARPMLSPQALRVTEAAFLVLASAGFDRGAAARGYRALFTYTFGFASFNSPEDPAAARRYAVMAIDALPSEEYPTLSRAASEAADTFADDSQFEFGLERLLDGLEAELKRRPN